MVDKSSDSVPAVTEGELLAGEPPPAYRPRVVIGLGGERPEDDRVLADTAAPTAADFREEPWALTDAVLAGVARTRPNAVRIIREHGITAGVLYYRPGARRSMLKIPGLKWTDHAEFDRAVNDDVACILLDVGYDDMLRDSLAVAPLAGAVNGRGPNPLLTDTSAAGAWRFLRDYFAARCVRLGEFTLASGRTSPWYVDSKQVLLDGLFQATLSRVLFDRTRHLAFDACGGPEVGALPLACALNRMRSAAGLPCAGFYVRKQPKAHGTRQMVEGPVREGAAVLMLDDVLTTAGSVLRAADEVLRLGARVAGVACLVDRQEGAKEAVEARGWPLVSVFTAAELIAAARGEHA